MISSCLHHALAVLLAVGSARARRDRRPARRRARTTRCAGSRSAAAGVADRADDAAEIRVRGEERRLDQRRMRDPKRDAPAFLPRRDRPRRRIVDELGRALAVAHDRLREVDRDRLSASRSGGAAADRRRADRRERRLRRSRRSTKLSLVDVSPSTVAQLNETSATSRASAASSARVDRARRWRRTTASSPCSDGSCRRPWRCR